MPASRNARAITFAPRSCPSRPGFATSTRIFRLVPTVIVYSSLAISSRSALATASLLIIPDAPGLGKPPRDTAGGMRQPAGFPAWGAALRGQPAPNGDREYANRSGQILGDRGGATGREWGPRIREWIGADLG